MPQIPVGGVCQLFAVFVKTGSVTATVPTALMGIPFERAAHMAAAGAGGAQKVENRVGCIDCQLGF